MVKEKGVLVLVRRVIFLNSWLNVLNKYMKYMYIHSYTVLQNSVGT